MSQQFDHHADSVDGLLGRIDLIESQPLDQRARGYDQLAEELLADLQRNDNDSTESRQS